MGKEELRLELDEAAMSRLREAGVDPQAYVQQVLVRGATAHEPAAAREARHAGLKAEMAQGLAAYDALIDAAGDWSADLRAF